MGKTRLDLFLAEQKLSQSREKARREIISGWVKVNGETVHNPAARVTGGESIVVARPGGQYVSRGGEKLAAALLEFKISLDGKTAVDLGASTGGFTDCLLKNGARKVYAVDVGYGQLDFSLRSDARVVVMERTNARLLTVEDFPENIDFITADLSFISITKVADTIASLFPHAEGIILVKPQFESEPGENKKGVVRREEVHAAIMTRVLENLSVKGFVINGLTHSPIKGPKGNIEFLLYYTLSGKEGSMTKNDIVALVTSVVKKAHEILTSAM